MQKLILLQSQIRATIADLNRARDEAEAAGDNAKAEEARKQAVKLTAVTSRLQQVINQNAAINLDALANGLESVIRDQVAFGLLVAARTLAQAVKDLTGRQVAVPPAGDGASGSAPAGSPSVAAQSKAGATSLGAFKAKDGPKREIVEALIKAAEKAKLDPLTVLAIVAIESDFRLDARNPVSSAGGLFQFIDSTWEEIGGKKAPGGGGAGNGHASFANLATQARLGCKLTAANAKGLTSVLGREPEPGELYMAHQQGLGGAKKILKLFTTTPSAPVTDAIGEKAARNNGLDGMTVAQARDKFRDLMRAHLAEIMALVERDDDAAAAAVAAAESAGGAGAQAEGAASTVTRIGARAASEALEEMELFARSNGVVVTETEPQLEARVLHYFRLVGRPDITSGSAEPWSAAFISFCLREAGATTDILPIGSANHAEYIHLGLKNRLADKADAPIVYFDRHEIAPRVGDLVGFSRSENVRTREDIARLDGAFFPSHTDLVLDVRPGALTVIGGNKSDTINKVTIALDDQGHMRSDKYFFVLRINV